MEDMSFSLLLCKCLFNYFYKKFNYLVIYLTKSLFNFYQVNVMSIFFIRVMFIYLSINDTKFIIFYEVSVTFIYLLNN
jgi:hypothetical protein